MACNGKTFVGSPIFSFSWIEEPFGILLLVALALEYTASPLKCVGGALEIVACEIGSKCYISTLFLLHSTIYAVLT
jgi:hypothetical protein